tara:strand:- start:621948 stop:623546 length:1599 start_codon:yes stop_codon:yes gene_type:complete
MKFKDQLKIYIFPKLIMLLTKIGFSYETLGRLTFFNKSIPLAQAKSLGEFEVEGNEKPQHIYVLLMLSGSTFHLYIEAILALGLKKKGHQVTFVIDDNTLPINELKKINNEKEWDSQTKTDFIYASKLLIKLKLNHHSISEFISDAPNLIYNDKYNSILEASLLKHYKVGIISEDLPELTYKSNLIKESIAITTYIGEKVVKLNPDKVIMNHGIYSTWGPPFQLLLEAKIPTLVHSTGKRKHSQVFNWNQSGNTWEISEEWNRVKDIELSKSQLKTINDYLKSRILHKDDIYIYNFGDKTSKEETVLKLGLDTSKPVYTLFTNVLWDAASAHREIAFKNPIDWVIETIQWFNEHPEKQLIVKIHPAEIIIGTKMPFYDIIVSRITPKGNVKIIQPNEEINSWSIYEITDLGLVHTTTSGMELPLVNKPCIVVSQTHYRNKGFTMDINSKTEYFELLSNFDLNLVDTEKNRNEALKYAHLLFIRFQIPFNMFFENVTMDVRGFKYNRINEYMNDAVYDKIIDSIEHVKPIFND